MLVVTRKPEESIVLRTTSDIPAGTELVVMVCGLRLNSAKVSLGIEAPMEFVILRAELLEAHDGRTLLADQEQQRHDADSATGTESNG